MPAFYERDEQGVPRRWVGLVKDAIRTVAPHFCTRRMVKEYVERMYERGDAVSDAGCAPLTGDGSPCSFR